MSASKGIDPEEFYGPPTAAQVKIEAILKESCKKPNPRKEKFTGGLLGPSQTWEVFKKQKEALDACLSRRNGLMCFAFEQETGQRLFLVSHPKFFWFVDSQCRLPNSRRSYEVIQEFSVCKLYLDVEYEIEFNSNLNGTVILDHFLKVVNRNLKSHFNVICTETDILDLDSTTSEKFSHHIIYQMQNTAFQDNCAVGNFVKMICLELKDAYENMVNSGDNQKLQDLAAKYQLEADDILQFFVKDRKGKIKLLIDEGVYTKNRHFRLLGSSKLNKNAPLVLSANNKYQPSHNTVTKNETSNCQLFLDSLITYFSSSVIRILEFNNCSDKKRKFFELNSTPKSSTEVLNCGNIGPYPEIDKFINDLIYPKGKIRKKYFFNTTFKIVYEISGYRYCHNIEREHKSNNIKYVVDLNELNYYQKCFDPDCSNYRSQCIRLPEEIRFLFEDDGILKNDHFLINDLDLLNEDIIKAVELIENSTKNDCEFNNLVTDDELCEAVNCIEDCLNVEW